jgi:hypothetical protein
MLQPDGAAVVVMASRITEDKFADAMGQFGGKLLKTSPSGRGREGIHRRACRGQLSATGDEVVQIGPFWLSHGSFGQF